MDAGYLALAAKYVRRQAKQLAEQLDGICQAEDIEFVHRARVASRRLRIALRMFRDCFGRKRAKRWRKQIRRLTAELGDARDKDVQIEFLCGILDELKERGCYPGIARLLVQVERQREQLQPKVVGAIERLRTGRIVEEMQTTAKRILADLKAPELTPRTPFACAQTGRHICSRLEELLAHQDSLRDAEDKQRHHAMRIAAKRLRYTLEIAKPAYDEQLEAIIEGVRKVQTLLGEIHDCDVWIDQLGTFAEAERKNVRAHFGHDGPFMRLGIGIEYLRQNRRGQRRKAFGELVAYWEELHRQDLWENLFRILHAPAGQPAEEPAGEPAAGQPAEEPAEPSAEEPGEPFAEGPADRAAVEPAESPAQPLPAALPEPAPAEPAAAAPPAFWHALHRPEVREDAAQAMRVRTEQVRESQRPPQGAIPPAAKRALSR